MRVEWLMLADSAEVLGNKLYLLGGGWTCLRVGSEFPVGQHFAVAAAVSLEAGELGRAQEFALDILNPAGKLLATLEAEFQVQALEATTASVHRWQFASLVDLLLEGPGCYPIVVHLNGEETMRSEFEVV
jgi:hypothetical protein